MISFVKTTEIHIREFRMTGSSVKPGQARGENLGYETGDLRNLWSEKKTGIQRLASCTHLHDLCETHPVRNH